MSLPTSSWTSARSASRRTVPIASASSESAERVWARLARAGSTFEETSTELLGMDSCHGPLAQVPKEPGEVVLRLGVKDRDRGKVDRFGKELAPLVTAGPPGVTGFAGGRPK